MNDDSFTIGLQLGFLKSFQPGWVIGLESDFTYPDTNAKFSLNDPINNAFDAFQLQNYLQGSVRIRAGVATGRLLPYMTAGASLAGMALHYRNETGDYYSRSKTQIGSIVGTGIEYKLINHLSGRIEYLYTYYKNRLTMGIANIDAINTYGTIGANLYTNTVRAAINYRF
jgi:outer membrane immunogenic protein